MRTDYKLTDLPPEAQKHSRIFRLHRFIDAASVGMFSVVIILLLQDRGFGLFDISVLLAVFSGTGLLLELPLGGLADGIGRKPVFMGVRMALMSGTLAAWFVERFKSLAPEFSTQPVLAKNQFSGAIGLAFSSILGGFIADFFGGNFSQFGIGKYELPLVGSFILGIIIFFYTHFLIIETSHKLDGKAIKRGFTNLGNIIADAGHYGFRNKTIATMLMGAGCMSLAFFTFQSFWVPFVKPMLNGEFATSIIGFLTFGLFLSQAMGTMLAKPAINLCRGNMAKALAGLTFISAAGLLAISFSSDIIYFALTLVLFSLFIGSMHSPYASLFHDNLPNDKRSTLLSLVSLVERLGGLVGLLFIGYIAEYFSIPTAFQIGSIFILVAGILYLTLPHCERNISNH